MANTITIEEYLRENEDLLESIVEELDDWNGFLMESDRYYPMESLNEFYYNTNIEELINRLCFGYDDDTNGSFNPTRDYFYYNGYGNLVSTDYKDYTGYIDEYLVSELMEHRDDLYSIDEDETLSHLLDELEQVE